jgi:hypothetical protein
MKKLTFLLIALFTMLACAVMAQVADTVEPTLPPFPIEPGALNLDLLLKWTDGLYGALVIITGYLSSRIPGIKLIPKTAWRVAAIALVLGMIFITSGTGAPLALLFSYLGATSLYDLILSLIKKTPKPDEPAPDPVKA